MDIWTNNTWANWLKDHGVPENVDCLIEVVGWPMTRAKKVIAISKQRGGEDLFNAKRDKTKRHTIARYYTMKDGSYVTGSLKPSYDSGIRDIV